MRPRSRVYGAQHGLSNRGLGKMGLSKREEVLVKHQWGIHFAVWGWGVGDNTDGEQTTKKWEADEHAKR